LDEQAEEEETDFGEELRHAEQILRRCRRWYERLDVDCDEDDRPPLINKAKRNAEILRLVEEGNTPASVAAHFGLSKAHVYSLLVMQRDIRAGRNGSNGSCEAA